MDEPLRGGRRPSLETKNILASISARVEAAVNEFDDADISSLQLLYQEENKVAVDKLISAQRRRAREFDKLRFHLEGRQQKFEDDDWDSEEEQLQEDLAEAAHEEEIARSSLHS